MSNKTNVWQHQLNIQFSLSENHRLAFIFRSRYNFPSLYVICDHEIDAKYII